MRAFPAYKGQKNFTGWRWVATTGRHVGFESWLERDHLTLLDYDPALTAICSQPFTVIWREGRRERTHTPDYFARAVDGSALVLDVTAQAQITQRDAAAFAATAQACREVGWRYERVGELDPVYRANMRWLAAYRHPRFGDSPAMARVRACFAQPTPLFAGAQAAGDRITTLPLVYHLLWRQTLRADLRAQVISPSTLVWDAHATAGGVGSRPPSGREHPEAGAMPALRVPDLSDRPQPEGALMTDAARVLRVEDHVRFEGRTWRVAALAGAAVTLADHEGRRKQLWLTELYLHGSPVHPDKRPRHVPSGTLKLLKEPVLKQARWWETHILEVITGVPPGAPPDTAPRPEYDPSTRTLAEREQAKSAELRRAGHGRGASAASVKAKRLRYQARGLEGLVDGHSDPDRERAVDPRYIAALRQLIKEAKDESTRNAKFFRWKTELSLSELYGRGAVPQPSRATFYRLFDELTVGRHTTGSARTRRSVAVQPPAPFGVYSVTRPGELMEIDSTPLDIAVRLPRGVVGRVELTAIIDVGSRSVPAAVLRPTTKAVDASLLVARTVTPELMRPGWVDALRMSRSVLPYPSMLSVDERLAHAAASPVIVPENIVYDKGAVFVSDNFRASCHHLGIDLQPAPPGDPTKKPHIERTIWTIGQQFAQYDPHIRHTTVGRGPLVGRLRDLTAEAAARGQAPILLSPAADGPGSVGAGNGRRTARDHQLPTEVAERLAAAVPPNTRRAWSSRFARYQVWCKEQGHGAPLPPTAAMLAAYLDHLGHDQGLKVSTLEAHLGSIMALTRMWAAGECERRAALRADKQARGLPLDEAERAEHDPHVPNTTLARKTIAAYSRRVALDPAATPGAKRAAPLLSRDIRAMIDAIDPGELRGLRDRALILLAFAMGRRGAEIAAVTFNDLTEPEDGDGDADVLRVRVRLSKTNSSGMKEDHVDVPRGTDLRYCPVHAVRRWQLELTRRGHADGPLFVRLDQRGRLGTAAGSPARSREADDGRITQKSVYRILRQRAAAAGVDVRVLRDGSTVPRQISAHSTRRGFVTAAFAAGADPLHVARHAGFTPGSKILYRYVDESLKNNPARGLLDPAD